jgi:dienelactone hydrolase
MFPAQLVVLVLLIVIFIRPVIAAFRFTRPPRRRPVSLAPADWGVACRDVAFDGAGGVKLAGWYAPSRNGAAIILLHGHGGNRQSVASQAEELARAGYGVVLFDLRAHGISGGRRFACGEEAINDALAAVRFLNRQTDVGTGHVGIMGVSAGGALALQAASRLATIRAVAVVSPTPGAVEDILPPAGLLDQFWHNPMAYYYLAAIDWFSPGSRPPANVTALAGLARRPVLFISAGGDREQRLTRRLFEAAAEPKQWWVIPRVSRAAGAEEYARKLVEFFDCALANAPQGTEASPARMEGVALQAPGLLEDAPPKQSPVYRLLSEHTVRSSTAMMVAFATIPLAMLLLVTPFTLRWGLRAPRLPEGWALPALLGLLALLMGGWLLHELLHLAAYRLFGRAPRGAARLALGRAAWSPQVECDQPIAARAYRRVLAFPGLVLGVLPGLAAIATGSWLLLIWSIWMVVVAGGDVAALWAMRGVPAEALVFAHPTRLGCEVIAQPHSGLNNEN